MTTERFTIGVATPPGMSAAYAYLCPIFALGLDREEGLACRLYYGDEPATTARGVARGQCDIACLNTIVGFLGRDEGLPMVAVGSKARRTHRYFAVAPESPIGSLAELKGKRIACDFPRLQTLAEAALAEEGVTREAFQWVPWQGSGMAARGMVEPLRRSAVDAIFVMDWNDGDFIAEGLPLRHLPSRLLERIRVSSCYWSTEARLAAAPDLLTRGVRAMLKSLVFAFENPSATLELMWESFPETRPAPAERARAGHRERAILEACLEPMRLDPRDGDQRWGAISAAEMTGWHEMLRRSGALGRPLDPAALFTNALVPGLNAFDAEAMRRRARAHAAAR